MNMKKLLLLLFPVYLQAQTFNLQSLTSDYSRPMAGYEKWYYDWQVSIPNVKASDQYFRFSWAGLNPGDGVYDWTFFDTQIKSAIDNGYGFSFGIMSCYTDPGGSPGIASFDGGNASYPQWVHDKMQKESVKDWLYSGSWIPNWNSDSYLSAVERFCKDLNAHLYNTTYKGVVLANVINSVDIRMFGNWGEWHTYPFTGSQPSGTRATSATLKRIIDAHINAFPNFWLSMMVAALGDGESPAGADITYYLLTAKNNRGSFGIRRDSWWLPDSWANGNLFENNPRSYNGVQLKTLIMSTWQRAPLTGEPMNGNNGADALNEINRYHVNSCGNGNGLNGTANASAANKAMGARIGITGGNVSMGNTMKVALNWSNTGITRCYLPFDVYYELKNGSGAVVLSGKGKVDIQTIMPGTVQTIDELQLVGVPKGGYTLDVILKDPHNYRNPYPLNNVGRQSDGSYKLTNIVVGNIVTPVNLVYFRYANGRWEWQTASEQNTAYHFIERSDDGGHTWKRIAVVKSKAPGGNSSSTLNYKWP